MLRSVQFLVCRLECRGAFRVAVAGVALASFGLVACRPAATTSTMQTPVQPVARQQSQFSRLQDALAKIPRRERLGNRRATGADAANPPVAKVESMKTLRLLIATRIGMSWDELKARCDDAVAKAKEQADWKFDFPIARELEAMLALKRTQFASFSEPQRQVIDEADKKLQAFQSIGRDFEKLQTSARNLLLNIRDDVESISAEIDRIDRLEQQGKPVADDIEALLADDGIVAKALDHLESNRAELELFAQELEQMQQGLKQAADALKQTLDALALLHPDVGPLVKAAKEQADKTVETIVKVFLALTNPLFALFLLFSALFGSSGEGGGGQGEGGNGVQGDKKGPQQGDSEKPSNSAGTKAIGSGKEKFDALPEKAESLHGLKQGENGDWVWLPYQLGGERFIGLRHKRQTSIREELRFNLSADGDFAELEKARAAEQLTVAGIHAPDLYPITIDFKGEAQLIWRLRWKTKNSEPVLLKGYANPTDIPPDASAVPLALADALEDGDHSYDAVRDAAGKVKLRIYIRKSAKERIDLPLPLAELGLAGGTWRLTGVENIGQVAATAFPVELLLSTDGGKSTTHRLFYAKAGEAPRVVTGIVSAGAN